MDTQVIFIIAFMVIAYIGVFVFMRMKKKQQQNMFQDIDVKTEMNKAEQYIAEYLNNDVKFLTKQMDGKSIDAFHYANNHYSSKDSIKDGMKDGLKGLATLGTVKFSTLQTAKYLVLSNNDLHLFDTDTDGEISDHLIFDAFRLEKSSITELPLEGINKAFAAQKGPDCKAYNLSLATENKSIDLLIFSALVLTYSGAGAGMFSMNNSKVIKELVIGNDFLKKLGNKYPNLKVATL